MTDDSSPAAEPRTVAFRASGRAGRDAARPPRVRRGAGVLLVLVALLAIAALAFAWRADQRVRSIERELVQRQQDSADRVAEATVLARQAQDGAARRRRQGRAARSAPQRDRRCSAASSRT